MIFYLKEEFLSFDHFDIWDENENLVYSANREFFNFGKKLIVQDASGRQAAAVQHVPFSLPCTYALTIGGREYDLTRNFAFFSRSYSLDELGCGLQTPIEISLQCFVLGGIVQLRRVSVYTQLPQI